MARRATGQVVERERKGGVTFGLRFRAYGRREFQTLGSSADGWTRKKAEAELTITLAQVERGTWQAPTPAPAVAVAIDPTFHEFASEWFASKQREIRPNTVRSYRNDLTHHLLPWFAEHRLSQITIREVDRYRAHKVAEGRLAARSINMTLALLAQVMEVAVEYGHVERNPATGRRRRLKAQRAKPVYLDSAEHIAAMLEAASAIDAGPDAQTSGRRPVIAVMIFAGLRAHEVEALRWRDVNLAAGRVTVGASKTAAGVREVDVLGVLRDELAVHKAASRHTKADELVFTTRTGAPRDRYNLRQRVVLPVARTAAGLLEGREDAQPLPAGVSPHKLRHTFASILVALGNDPAYVMGQLGHTDPAFTLRVYSHMMRRDTGERDRLRALVGGAAKVPDPGSVMSEAPAPT